jgi:carbon monoxide dehydrogenase subunit G
MSAVSVSTRVAAPVAEVFALFTDLKNAAGRVKAIKRIELLTNGPVGVGTRFRETRVMFKRDATEEMEITEFEPNRRYTVGANSCGARFTSIFQFRPDGDGTVVTLEINSKPVSLLAKLLSPLAGLMKGMMLKCVQQDLNDLKAVAESTARTA